MPGESKSVDGTEANRCAVGGYSKHAGATLPRTTIRRSSVERPEHGWQTAWTRATAACRE